MAKDDNLLDTRLIDRNIRKGLIKQSELDTLLKKLPDDEANAEFVTLNLEDSEITSEASSVVAATIFLLRSIDGAVVVRTRDVGRGGTPRQGGTHQRSDHSGGGGGDPQGHDSHRARQDHGHWAQR